MMELLMYWLKLENKDEKVLEGGCFDVRGVGSLG